MIGRQASISNEEGVQNRCLVFRLLSYKNSIIRYNNLNRLNTLVTQNYFGILRCLE